MTAIQKTTYAMMRLMARMMPSCRDISALISEGMDHELTWRQRMGIRLHVSMCKLCRRYQKQLHLLRHGCHRYADAEANEATPHISAEARARLEQALADQMK